ncbi:MAG: hypothetical protein WD768_22225 [Phycisphaeraceae bacterium]
MQSSPASNDFSEAGPDEIFKALRLPASPDSEWSESDLREMLQHALDAPLVSQVAQTIDEAVRPALEKLTQQTTPAIQCLRDLFKHPQVPRDLLAVVKDFAKVSADHPTRPLPRDLTRVLYYAVIVAAKQQGEDISSLSETSLRKSTRWALEQPWLDADLKELFEKR